MKFGELLLEKEPYIVKQWFETLIATYPSETAKFFCNLKDDFANPVGSTSFKCVKDLFAGLIREKDHETLRSCLDPVIRIRTVQTIFTPSQATGFILDLKKIVRKSLKKELKNNSFKKEIEQFDSKVDSLALIAFDLFVKCKEQIYQLKVDTERNKIYKAFRRAGLVSDITDNQPSL